MSKYILLFVSVVALNAQGHFTVYPQNDLVVSEFGISAQISIRMDSLPSAEVQLPLTLSDDTEAILSANLLTFSVANWQIVQVIKVTGIPDQISDGDQVFQLNLGVVSSEDPNYNAMDLPDLNIININTDPPGIALKPASGLRVLESGSIDSLAIVLLSAPSKSVTIGLSVDSPTEVSLSPSSVTFIPGNWNVPQWVEVTGIDDNVNDGDKAFTVITAPAQSDDLDYHDINAIDVSGLNLDNDGFGFIIYPLDNLTVSEDAQYKDFFILANSRPAAHVIIPLVSSMPSEGELDQNFVVINEVNYINPQQVRVTGINDDMVDGNRTFAIITEPSISKDISYNNIDITDLVFTNLDNDSARVLVVAKDTLYTNEHGGNDSLTVHISSKPFHEVKVPLAVADATEGSLTSDTLVITADNWNQPQQITVSGVEDNTADGDQSYSLKLGPIVSNDSHYDGLSLADITVTNLEPDTLGPAFTTPLISPASPSFNELVQVSVDVTDAKSTVSAVQLQFLRGDESAFTTMDMTQTEGNTFTGTIPQSYVTWMGLSYIVEARDNLDNVSRSDTLSVPVRFGEGYLSTAIKGSALSQGMPRDSWRMISIPAQLDNGSVVHNLGDEFGDSKDTRWLIWQRRGSAWLEANTLVAGESYWLVQNIASSVPFDVGAGTTVDAQGYELTLYSGWNLIGSPYPYVIDLALDQTQFYGPITYGINVEGWTGVVNQLQPWGGYAVYNRGNALRTVVLNPLKDGAMAKTDGAVAAEPGWRLKLGVEGETYGDGFNYIGQHPAATEDLDHYDNPEPVSPGKYIRLYMPADNERGKVKLSADMRSMDSEQEIWEVMVDNRGETGPITLSWQLTGDLPEGQEIAVVDVDARRAYSLSDSGMSVNEQWDWGIPYPMKVLYGSADWIRSAVHDMLSSLPETFALHQAYPNPFNPVATIRFDVPQAASVDIRVYNLIGQHVATLTSQLYNAGYHQVQWRGINNLGRPVGTGMYIYQMRSRGFVKSEKMILMK